MAKPKPTVRFIPESRDAAAQELMTLADRMFRGGQNLMRQAARLIKGDPDNNSKALRALVRYQTDLMPAYGEAARIEAVLRGVPIEQCLSEVEKKRRARAERQRIHDEAWKRIHESADPERTWRELWNSRHPEVEAEKPAEAKVRSDGVIQGPWGTA